MLSKVKEFIRDNADTLYIKRLSQYDPQGDVVVEEEGAWRMSLPMEDNRYNHGASGAFFVGDGQDAVSEYAIAPWRGYKVENSCGSFILAVPMTLVEGLEATA